MENTTIPDFSLASTGGGRFSLHAARGRPLVLYFYPKDATPGCTTEAQQFRDLYSAFREAGCAIYGVSRDSIRSHESFKAKLKLPFELLSDPEETACEIFAVMKTKNMYGKQVRGIERSTFVLDREGVLRRTWRSVKVADHARDVLEFVKSL
jgi:peroxiredoxin Q/BCP